MKYVVWMTVAINLVLNVSASFAENKWYSGQIRTVQTLGPNGDFMVYFDNAEIDGTCLHKRVRFKVSDMGVERTKLAYTMALAAVTTGKKWGVVVNLPAVGEICYASGTSSQGASISRW